MPNNSKARIEANNRYNAKAYDRINIAIKKGSKAKIQAHAESKGESLNGFIKRAIKETISRDNEMIGK
ncbi:hypothetical protein [Pseudoruminococcus massiliensis]|uniref:hypothetical protein n=1 Tax=Pseudoruminococcus massiliensis TaxID=2086583 RepID=UPI000D103292|nr:hypothetical protein [Pseudoruminococcus massiliensis]